MMAETARRFLDRGVHSFVWFAGLGDATVRFFDHTRPPFIVRDNALSAT